MQFNNRNMDDFKRRYPAGTRLELISMEGECDMPVGLRGTVEFIDDAGQIHLRWDNGRSLALVPGVDSFRTLTSEELAAELAEQKLSDQVSVGEIYTSQDFQCDQTGGYPTVLVWNMNRGTAILQPAPAFDDDTEEARQCIRDCADWGAHPCVSWAEYHDLLESVGEDAVRNAYVSPDEDESEEFGGLNLQ